jgi:PucR C-terminal helix-turn-helix domain/GGDEF-like domain
VGAAPGSPSGAAPRASAARPGLSDATIRRVEQATGRLATQSVARMDEELAWFRQLPADQRSWVSLVAQAGLQSYVDWLRSPDDVLRMTGEVFASAPRAMARSVTLQQTVELVRLTIAVAEDNLPALVGSTDAGEVHEQLLRFSREIAFAAARVYASAAESRGSWDERLEALVIDGLVRGAEVGDPLDSQLAALGWRAGGPMAAVVGSAPDGRDAISEVHRLAATLGVDAIAGVHGGRLIVAVGGSDDPEAVARRMLPLFGLGPVVVGPLAAKLDEASAVTRAALSGLRASIAWPGAPRPVTAEALLPERALAGDAEARDTLVQTVYQPLELAGPVLLDTVTAFLDSGGALETTARALFVHPNTVRYRLRRAAEICGAAPTTPRGAFTLRIALACGRLDRLGSSDKL